jgi:hypothetical protein
MSIMTDWQFQCATTSCVPFASVIVSNIRRCQMSCLAQVKYKAASFHQSTSRCDLFTIIPNPSGNMVANMNVVTMIVIVETRIPPG